MKEDIDLERRLINNEMTSEGKEEADLERIGQDWQSSTSCGRGMSDCGAFIGNKEIRSQQEILKLRTNLYVKKHKKTVADELFVLID